MRLENKVAVITGSGTGIGETIAKVFAKEGAKVVVCARSLDKIKKVAEEIINNGGKALAVPVDISDKSDVEKLFNTTIKEFGKLDILVNNAGITDDARLIKMKEETFDKVIEINLKGTFLCGQAAATIMLEHGKGGVIINASSAAAMSGNFGQSNYSASKGGVISLTKTWAKELSPKGIRVNCVSPGFIYTSMVQKMPGNVVETMKGKTLLNRMGTTQEVANMFLFLASDEASYITGSVFNVDGGLIF